MANNTLSMILRNLRTEIARIEKDNEMLREHCKKLSAMVQDKRQQGEIEELIGANEYCPNCGYTFPGGSLLMKSPGGSYICPSCKMLFSLDKKGAINASASSKS